MFDFAERAISSRWLDVYVDGGLILQVRRHHPCGKSMQSLLVAVTLRRPYAGSSVYYVFVHVSVCVGDAEN